MHNKAINISKASFPPDGYNHVLWLISGDVASSSSIVAITFDESEPSFASSHNHVAASPSIYNPSSDVARL
jgi:hypothetical protein